MLKPGFEALKASNQPVAILAKPVGDKMELWVVNDRMRPLQGVARYALFEEGELLLSGDAKCGCLADDRALALSVHWTRRPGAHYALNLRLEDESGELLSENRYAPFDEPMKHIQGHPHRLDNELGVRLYGAEG